MADDAIAAVTDDAVVLNPDDAIVEFIPDDSSGEEVEAPVGTRASIKAEIAQSKAQEDLSEAPESPEKPDPALGVVIPGTEQDKPVEVKLEAPEPVADDTEKDAKDVEDAPKPGTFRVKGPDGKFVETPDVKVELRVGDKVYTKDLAGLTRMAFDGIHGQKASVRVAQLEQEVPRIQQSYEARLQEVSQAHETSEKLLEEVLKDPTGEKWAEYHEKYTQLMSPEAQLERTRAELNQQRETQNQQYEAQQRSAYYTSNVEPVLHFVNAEAPDVSDVAKTGRIAILTGDLLVNGRIPSSAYPELVRRLNVDYVPWARAEQAKTSEARTNTEKVLAEEKAKLEKERRTLQRQQNASVREVAPKGAVPSNVTPQLPRPRTRAEAREQILGREWE